LKTAEPTRTLPPPTGDYILSRRVSEAPKRVLGEGNNYAECASRLPNGVL
jgi:hypothetical protein